MTDRDEAIRLATAALTASEAHDESVRRAVCGQKPKPLDIEVLMKIAEIAKVPDTELAALFSYIHSLVGIACGVARRRELWQASDMTNSTKRIAAAARELEKALEAASEGVREQIRLLFEPRKTMEQLDEYRKMAAELADVAITAKKLLRTEPFVQFRRLILEQLLSDIDRTGGRLTYTKTGTLMEVLAALKPYLPDNFEMSFSQARRIWREAKKAKNGPI